MKPPPCDTELLLPEARMLDLAGYLETALHIARDLRKTEGMTVELALRLDPHSATALLVTPATPQEVVSALERRHMRYHMIDFHDDAERTIVTWQIDFLHQSFALISQRIGARLAA